jgi:hypothetical protein
MNVDAVERDNRATLRAPTPGNLAIPLLLASECAWVYVELREAKVSRVWKSRAAVRGGST